MGILVAPAGTEFVELALKIGDAYALAPGKERWNNETDALPASGRSITEDVLRASVPQVVRFTGFVRPGSHINSIVAQEAGRLDIAPICPASRTVQEGIYAKTAAKPDH
jgi:hypothetical protein